MSATFAGLRAPWPTPAPARSAAEALGAGGEVDPQALARAGVAHVLAALACTLAAPLWTLLLAPVLFGVPHVAADMRFLVLRPGLRRVPAAAVLGPLAVIAALRLHTLCGGPARPGLEIAAGVLAVAAGILGARGRAALRAGLALLVLLLGAAAVAQAGLFAVGLSHAHNAVAFAILLAWMRPGSARPRAVLAGAFLAAVLLLASGLLAPRTLGSAGGLTFTAVAASLAPGLAEAAATRLVLVYAFAQAVHFAVWLHLVPRAAGTGGSLRSSLAGLRRDFGLCGLLAVAAFSLAVPAAALLDPVAARAAYLSLAVFHGWLELALVPHLLLDRRA